MKFRIKVKHPTAKKRMYREVELDSQPVVGDVLDLGKIVKPGLPSVKVIATCASFPPALTEINTVLKNGAKFPSSKCDKLFLYEDGWSVYRSSEPKDPTSQMLGHKRVSEANETVTKPFRVGDEG